MDDRHLGERTLRCFTWDDVRRMVEGDSFVSVDNILQALRFVNFPNRTLPGYFIQTVKILTDDERVMLLKFTTGQTRMPIVPQLKEKFCLIILYQPVERH
jgi:hypothetical protein